MFFLLVKIEIPFKFMIDSFKKGGFSFLKQSMYAIEQTMF